MTTIKNLLSVEESAAAPKPGSKAETHLLKARQHWRTAKETYPAKSSHEHARLAKKHADLSVHYKNLGEDDMTLDQLEQEVYNIEEADVATQIKFHTSQMNAASKAYNSGKGIHHYAIHQFHKKKIAELTAKSSETASKPKVHDFRMYKSHDKAAAGSHGVTESVDEMPILENIEAAHAHWKLGREIANKMEDHQMHARMQGKRYHGTARYHADKAEYHEAMAFGHGFAHDHHGALGDKAEAATHARVRDSHTRMVKHHEKLAESHTVSESTPPGMEDDAKSMKPNFKKQYGKKWANVLYATLWKKYNESVEVNINGERGTPGTVFGPAGGRKRYEATPPKVEVNLNGELGSKYMAPGKRVQVPSNPSTVAVNLNGERGGSGPEPGRYTIPPVGESDVQAMMGKKPSFHDFVAGFRDETGSYNTQRTHWFLNMDSGNTNEY